MVRFEECFSCKWTGILADKPKLNTKLLPYSGHLWSMRLPLGSVEQNESVCFYLGHIAVSAKI